MADATANAFHKYGDGGGGTYSAQIADGVTVFIGQLAQVQAGFVNHWDETGGFLGVIVGGNDRGKDGILLGETSDAIPPEARVDISGAVLKGLSSVAGTPSQAKVGDLVFSADSDVANLTMTDTTNPPVGRLWRFKSTSDVDVKLFTPGEHAAGIADATWNA